MYEHTFEMSSFLAKTVRFRLVAKNEIDSTSSIGYLSVLIAGIPATPSVVTANSEYITSTQISFTIPAPADTGGSAILSYHVEMDDGNNGDFTTIAGYSSDSLQRRFIINTGITQGNSYGVRYRSKNSIGWSDYSTVLYILAGQAPSAPGIPVFSTASATSLSITFGISESDGGSDITYYTSQIDKNDGNGYQDSGNYSEASPTIAFEINSTDPTKLQPGTYYKFRSYSLNSFETPSYSSEVTIAAAQLPGQASAPVHDLTTSNTTSISLTWSTVANTEINTLGYKLYRDNGNDGNFSLVFNGTNKPGQRAYISTGLTTGTIYRFKLVAVNFNGDGSESSEVSYPACLAPSSVTPSYESNTSTSTTIDLRWDAPSDVNGCALIGFKLYKGLTTDTSLTLDSTLSASLQTNPSARTATVTYTSSDTGTVYRFQIETINSAGSSLGGIAEIKLGSNPDTETLGCQCYYAN